MIFISIASYCDKMLGPTMVDAVEKAKYKNDLVFGVVEQAPIDNRLNARSKHIRYVGIDPYEARGVCWARSICMSLFQGEEFFLQIDSHMLFDKNWDETLIKSLESLPGKALISNYPNAFEIINGIATPTPASEGALFHTAKGNFNEHLTCAFEAQPTDVEFTQGFHIGAGCLFATGQFVYEIPYDPYLYFEGEEQSIAVRAWTHGWDIYHMRVPMYHLYDTDPDNCYRPKHWSKDEDEQRQQRWWELDARSKKRLVALLTGQDIGPYGLGTTRSLKEYEAFSGLEYSKCIIKDKARDYSNWSPVVERE